MPALPCMETLVGAVIVPALCKREPVVLIFTVPADDMLALTSMFPARRVPAVMVLEGTPAAVKVMVVPGAGMVGCATEMATAPPFVPLLVSMLPVVMAVPEAAPAIRVTVPFVPVPSERASNTLVLESKMCPPALPALLVKAASRMFPAFLLLPSMVVGRVLSVTLAVLKSMSPPVPPVPTVMPFVAGVPGTVDDVVFGKVGVMVTPATRLML